MFETTMEALPFIRPSPADGITHSYHPIASSARLIGSYHQIVLGTAPNAPRRSTSGEYLMLKFLESGLKPPEDARVKGADPRNAQADALRDLPHRDTAAVVEVQDVSLTSTE
jgi:hypothetical protein